MEGGSDKSGAEAADEEEDLNLDQDLDEEVVICRGITLEDIRTSNLNDKEKAEDGFIHVCREAIQSRAKLSRPDNHRYHWTIANDEAFQTCCYFWHRR